MFPLGPSEVTSALPFASRKANQGIPPPVSGCGYLAWTSLPAGHPGQVELDVHEIPAEDRRHVLAGEEGVEPWHQPQQGEPKWRKTSLSSARRPGQPVVQDTSAAGASARPTGRGTP